MPVPDVGGLLQKLMVRIRRSISLTGLIIAFLVGCSLPRDNSSTGTPWSSPDVSGTAVAEQRCVLTDGGRIHGTVTQAGEPVPDGAYVSLIFSGGGGLSERAVIRDGRYSLRLLARDCADGFHWVGFTIYAGGQGRGVFPTARDVELNLEAPFFPVTPLLPAQGLDFGEITGRVTVEGRPAPDGTLVTGSFVRGSPNLTQNVYTKDGQYSLTAIG